MLMRKIRIALLKQMRRVFLKHGKVMKKKKRGIKFRQETLFMQALLVL